MKQRGVYLSSTFDDSKGYRTAVFAALEKAGLSVARMEAYTAADERPLDLCLYDVALTVIYVGVYAWRAEGILTNTYTEVRQSVET